MLKVEKLEAGYGHIAALKGVDLAVEPGEFVAILGPNGAGKSTLMKAIIGVLRQNAGAITFADRRVDDLATAQRIRLGMGIIPEGRQLFFDMTVRENLILGAYAQLGLRIGPQLDTALDQIFTLFPRLHERQDQLAGSLSGGEAQMVAVGRALMSRPKLLLCDEPSLGLAPLLVRELLATLARLRDRASPSCSPTRTPRPRCALPTAPIFLIRAAWLPQAQAQRSPTMHRLRAAYLGTGVEGH